MKTFAGMLYAVLFLVIVLCLGCSTPPERLARRAAGQPFNTNGWSRVDSQGVTKIWKNGDVFAVTRNDRLCYLFPSGPEHDWIQMYEDGQPVVNIQRQRKNVNLTGPWKDVEIRRK